MSRNDTNGNGIDAEAVHRIINEVEQDVLIEDMTGASREMVAEGTCERIRRRVRELERVDQ